MQKGMWLSVNKTLFMKQEVSSGPVQATGSMKSASGFASRVVNLAPLMVPEGISMDAHYD